MSILNVFVYPDRGIVCADTDCAANGRHVEVSKLFPLVHQPAVIAFTGSILLQSLVVPRVMVSGVDFDDLSKLLPDILSASLKQAIGLAPQVLITEDFAGRGEVALVGFSAATGRITMHYFRCETLATGFEASLDRSFVSSPAWPDMGADLVNSIHQKSDMDAMKALAFEQARLIQEREPWAPGGGQLIVAEITRSSVTINTLCAFPARAEAG